jgi:hypothetical protein
MNSAVVDLTLKAKADKLADTVSRSTVVVPAGFPCELFASGTFTSEVLEAAFEVVIPKDVTKDSIKTEIYFNLSPVSNLTQALSSLVRMPCGCFGTLSILK